jgi:DNA-binding NtrC family response regulator
VRELKNVIERLVILADGNRLTGAQVEAVLPATAAAGEGDGEHPGSLRDAVRACERRHIQRAVGEAGGVMAEAARRLGLERSYLYRKMRDLGLERDD